MSSGPGNVPKRVLFTWFVQVLTMIIGIVITMHMAKVSKVSNQNTSTVGQVITDWQTIPFTSLTVTDDKCPSGTESMFVREWKGVQQGCLVNKPDTFGYGSSQEIMTVSEYDDYVRRQRNGNNSKTSSYYRRDIPCNPISMEPAVKQDEFWDMRFCGKRSGLPFSQVVRPTASTSMVSTAATCPSGYVACSTETSVDNTVCVQTSKKADCPFTLAKFVAIADRKTYDDDQTNYQVYTVDDDFVMVTSKTKGDNLPLTSFKIEEKPCLDNRDISISPTTQFYPLENDRKSTGCRNVKQYNASTDDRYQDLGRKISEYDVQEESDVLEDLEDLPNYSIYVTSSSKKSTMYGFWARPTISWKLSCDKAHPRDSVIKAAAVEKDKEALGEGWVIGLLSVGYGMGFLASTIILILFCIGKCARKDLGSGMHIATGVCLGIELILLSVATLLINGQKGELMERKEAIEALSFVNDCGDKYTNIPANFSTDIDAASSNIGFAVIAGALVCTMVLFASIACCAGGDSRGDEDYDHKYEEVPQE